MKDFLICLVVILSLIIIAIGVIILFNSSVPGLYKKELTQKQKDEVEFVKGDAPYLTKKNSRTPFRVISCADMHMSSEEAEFGLTILERLINKTNPDLVVLLGDNACSKDNRIENRLIELFEKLNVHYAFVLGNHDSEALINERLKKLDFVDKDIYDSISRECRFTKFNYLKDSKLCVCYNDDESIHGVGNCFVNIRQDNQTIQTLYFFDSGDYIYGLKRKDIGTEKRSYDYIHDDQVEWYKKKANLNKNDSIAFFHIPLYEYNEAYIKSLFTLSSTHKLFGNNYEKPCSSNIRGNAFEAFKENGTKCVVCGHDHKNDSCIEHQGVKLMYSQGLQYDGAYNRRKKPGLFKLMYNLGIKCYVEGISVFDISKNKVDVYPVYAETSGVFEGLEKYYKKAFIEGNYKK